MSGSIVLRVSILACVGACNQPSKEVEYGFEACGELSDVLDWEGDGQYLFAVEIESNHATVVSLDPPLVAAGATLYGVEDSEPSDRESLVPIAELGQSWNSGLVSDLNGDGAEELVVAGTPQRPMVSLLMSPVGASAPLAFEPPTQYSSEFGYPGFGVVQSTGGMQVLAVGQSGGGSDGFGSVVLLSVQAEGEGTAASISFAGTISGSAAHTGIGEVVDARADLNGDGLRDLVYSDSFGSHRSLVSGAVFVHYSPVPMVASVLDADILYSPLDGRTSNFGSDVSAGGDVDGDGLDDMAVTAMFIDNQAGPYSDGGVFILSDFAAGEPSLYARIDVPPGLARVARAVELVSFGDEPLTGVIAVDQLWPGYAEGDGEGVGRRSGTVFGFPLVEEGTHALCDAPNVWEAHDVGTGPDSVRRLSHSVASGGVNLGTSRLDDQPVVSVWTEL